jgi:hypothetical protein
MKDAYSRSIGIERWRDPHQAESKGLECEYRFDGVPYVFARDACRYDRAECVITHDFVGGIRTPTADRPVLVLLPENRHGGLGLYQMRCRGIEYSFFLEAEEL